MTDYDTLREADTCLICNRTVDQHDMGTGLPTCRGIAVPAFRSRAALTQLQAKVERLEAALEPSGDTKAAYHGEFHFNLTRVDECDDEYQERVYVPWTTVKEIMAAIRAYAARQALSDKVGG